MFSLTELLEYVLGSPVPDEFVNRILLQDQWDSEFVRRLDALAYEFRPDLAIWHIEADEAGRLTQLRLAPAVCDLNG